MTDDYCGHGDACTPALCLCGQGLVDGTPVVADYLNAGQPLPGFGKVIDMYKVLLVVQERLANTFEVSK